MTTNFFLFEMDRCLPAAYYCWQTKNLWPTAMNFFSPAIMLCHIEKKNPSRSAEGIKYFACAKPSEQEKLHSGQLYLLLQLHYAFAECTIGIHKILYRLAGVDNGSVIAATEMFSDGL